MLNKEEVEKMLEVAMKAEDNAFIFKSNHAYGAAVLTSDGEIFGGCNVDGVISSMGICAEMNAMNHAAIHGKYELKALLVVDEVKFVYPCGACLQYLAQFSQTNNVDIEVVSAKENGEYEVKKLSELLPKKYLSNSFSEKLASFKNK